MEDLEKIVKNVLERESNEYKKIYTEILQG